MNDKREITSHRVNGLNDKLLVAAWDRNKDGQSHRYEIAWKLEGRWRYSWHFHSLKFQEGPLTENGPNGISNEVLLAIVEDRLKNFQSGKFSCPENALALIHVQDAMHWLHHRTRDRLERGVEGTSKP